MKCLPCSDGVIKIIARFHKKASLLLCCFTGQQAERYLILLIHKAVKRDSFFKIISKNELLNLLGIYLTGHLYNGSMNHLYMGCAWIKKGLWQPEEDF